MGNKIIYLNSNHYQILFMNDLIHKSRYKYIKNPLFQNDSMNFSTQKININNIFQIIKFHLEPLQVRDKQ